MTEVQNSPERQRLLEELNVLVNAWKMRHADFMLDQNLSALDDQALEDLIKDLYARFGKEVIKGDLSHVRHDMLRPNRPSAVADEKPTASVEKVKPTIDIHTPPSPIIRPDRVLDAFVSNSKITYEGAEEKLQEYLSWVVEADGTSGQISEAKDLTERTREKIKAVAKQREEKKKQAVLVAAVPAGQTSSAASITGQKDQKETHVVFWKDSRVAILALLLIFAFGVYWLHQHPSDGIAAPDNGGSSTTNTTNSGNNQSSNANNGVVKTTQNQQATCPGDKSVADPRPAKGSPVEVEAGCNVKGDLVVSSSKDGVYKAANKNEASSGNILSCPEGCWIRADYGANITPRTVPDLYNEMKTSGCEGQKGCKTVTCWEMKGGNLTELANCPTSSGNDNGKAPDNTPSATPTSQAKACGDELKVWETRMVPAGCIIVGDVSTDGGPHLQKAGMNNRNDVGFVQVLTKDTVITAPYGAGVHSSPPDTVDGLVKSTKYYGCDHGEGCFGGVYDWSGKRLDQ